MAVEGHVGGDTGAAPSLLFAVRHGLAERADLGIRIVPDARADVRWNFLRTEVIDATIAPILWLGWLRWLATAKSTLIPGAGAELSLQADVRFSDEAVFTMAVGAGYAIMPPDLSEILADPPSEDARHGGLIHGALGIQLRLSRTFALHPQISVSFLELGADDVRVKEVFGIAFWNL